MEERVQGDEVRDAGKEQEGSPSGLTYRAAGVEPAEERARALLAWVTQTQGLNRQYPLLLPLGYFANVIRLDDRCGLAIATDGVGTKILLAQMLGMYDTIGIDAIAMNVNDVLCVGATPVSVVDYLAVQQMDPQVLEAIGRGLFHGAQQAGVHIAGGEIAQIREMLRGEEEGKGLDLVCTCVGVVPLDRIIIGQELRPGDVVIGVQSTGIHSNGLTLARKIFFDRHHLSVHHRFPELGTKTLGEELLTPTAIYVPEVVELLTHQVPIKAITHITGGGLLNLLRVEAAVGFVLDTLPEPPPIFSLIQSHGQVPRAEMYGVFNMGIGLCLVVEPGVVDQVLATMQKHGRKAYRIGYVTQEHPRQIYLEKEGLMGSAKEGFVPV
ncbi:MAG: phosphoribosylformylglycinamidine cyclo-ligase [Nitrospinota bacterium]|nr:MAG: phosphoribosylformylglycinamidine cyclo-ligase [Nitrospinota bacterium]